jgi:4'-phosphopantetheinyl transferase
MDSPDRQINIQFTELNRNCVFDPQVPELSQSSLQVWQFPLTLSDHPLDQYDRLLSEDERARAARYRFEKDARAFTVARASVRCLLARYIDARADDLRFDYAHYGKPALAKPPKDLRFSVSHSGDLGMLAVALGHEIGVDIENIQRNVDTDQLAERFFSERERVSLRQLSGDERARAFFRCWTSKEAFLKGQGLGLSRDLNSFDVEVDPNRPARLMATRPNAREAKIWSLYDISREQNYAAAVAWEGSIAEINILQCR